MSYTIRRTSSPPKLDSAFDSPHWADANVVDIAHYYDRSSDHRPSVQAKLLYDDAGLYLHYQVQDQYVRAIAEKNQDSVCRDSCVEAFLQPGGEGSYLNFEFNCGGTLLLYHVTGNLRDGAYAPVANDWLDQIKISTTLPKIVEPEITEPTTWRLAAFVPFALFEAHTTHHAQRDTPWRGNFYKCADATSHPHWASWKPVEGTLDFHKPQYFGQIIFE